MKGKGNKPANVEKAIEASAKKGGSGPFGLKNVKGELKPEGTTGKRRADRPARKMGGKC